MLKKLLLTLLLFGSLHCAEKPRVSFIPPYVTEEIENYYVHTLKRVAHAFTNPLDISYIEKVLGEACSTITTLVKLRPSQVCGIDARNTKPGWPRTLDLRMLTAAQVIEMGILPALDYLGFVESKSNYGAIKSHHLTPEVTELFESYSHKLKQQA